MKAFIWLLTMTGVMVFVLVVSSGRIQNSFAGAAALPGACTELVSDGGFEAGGQGWTQYSKLGYQLISSFYPRSGRLGAWLGAENNAQDRLSQLVVLPAQTDGITFSLWWALSTAELPGGAFDFLRAGLYTPDGTTQIVSLLEVSNDSAEQGVWNPLHADLSAYAGRSVQLRIEATTDDSSATDFFVDDVSILSCAVATTTPTVTRTSTPSPTLTPTTGIPSPTWTATRTATPTPTMTAPGPSPTWTATRTATSTPPGWLSPTPTQTRTPAILDRRTYLPVVLHAP